MLRKLAVLSLSYIAAVVVKRTMNASYKKTTHKAPPTSFNQKDAGWLKVLGWTMLVSALSGIFRQAVSDKFTDVPEAVEVEE